MIDMIAKDILDNIVQPVRLKDNCLQVLGWMEEYKVMRLPVADEGRFYGMLSESKIYGLEDPDVPVSEIAEDLSKAALQEDDYITDVLEHFVTQKIMLAPVISKQKEYLGCITGYSLLQAVGILEGVGLPGAVIVLEINQGDYLLSQIAHIAEESDIKLQAVHTLQHKDSMMLDVILKTNTFEINSFLKTLERYDYHIKMTLSDNDPENEKLEENYQYIMTYLNV